MLLGLVLERLGRLAVWIGPWPSPRRLPRLLIGLLFGPRAGLLDHPLAVTRVTCQRCDPGGDDGCAGWAAQVCDQALEIVQHRGCGWVAARRVFGGGARQDAVELGVDIGAR